MRISASHSGHLTDYNVKEELKQELAFNADLIIIAVGENAASPSSDEAKAQFAKAFANLFEELSKRSQPKLFVRSQFWQGAEKAEKAEKDGLMKQACENAGGVFIDVSNLGKDAANFARAEREIQHAGVAAHPGDNETRRFVTLTRPFAILEREITFDELIAFSPQHAKLMSRNDARPEQAGAAIDWYESIVFCRWLSQNQGFTKADQPYPDPVSLDTEAHPREPNPERNWAPRNWPLDLSRPGFRLPTESEWEVASRAGVRTAYGHGGDVSLLNRFGWFSGNSDKRLHTPRELRPSIRGLFDLHGNQLEWTYDWYGDLDEAATTDPVGALNGSFRINRGGSWYRDAMDSRSACRGVFIPTFRTNDLGVRLALTLPEISEAAEHRP